MNDKMISLLKKNFNFIIDIEQRNYGGGMIQRIVKMDLNKLSHHFKSQPIKCWGSCGTIFNSLDISNTPENNINEIYKFESLIENILKMDKENFKRIFILYESI